MATLHNPARFSARAPADGCDSRPPESSAERLEGVAACTRGVRSANADLAPDQLQNVALYRMYKTLFFHPLRYTE